MSAVCIELTPPPDAGDLLLGWAARQEAGAPLAPFLLGGDLAMHGEPAAPYIVMGAWPVQTLPPLEGVADADFPWQSGAGPLLARLAEVAAGGAAPQQAADPWQSAIAVGWIGHELPASSLARHAEYLVLEPAAGRARLVAAQRPGEAPDAAADRARRAVASVREDAAAGRRLRRDAMTRRLACRVTTPVNAARHGERVRRVLAAIAAGDVYQVNLAHNLVLDGFPLDPVGRAACFLRLWQANPVPYPAYVQLGSQVMLALSPERALAWRPDLMESCPIKGTCPRSEDPERDRLLARQLAASPKDRAENIMIADLVRNDLGRVAITGSVRVPGLCQVASFRSVHHLVSTVQASPAAGTDLASLLRAVHPAGSMTGAPKIRAVQILSELEGAPRGAYAGGVGWIAGPSWGHLAMVIRAVLATPGQARLPVGGGIVADSCPEAEYQETLDKASSLLRTLAADTAGAATARP